MLGCPAPRRLSRTPAWALGKGEQPVTLAMPLQLFDFIAQCVQKFLTDISRLEDHLPLGFVFPFSCKQTRLDKVSGTTLTCGHSCLLLSSSSAWNGAGPVVESNGSATCSPQAELISWSKNFSCSGVEGKDIVELLQSAINKQVGGLEGPGWGLRLWEGLMMLFAFLCPWPAQKCGGRCPDE